MDAQSASHITVAESSTTEEKTQVNKSPSRKDNTDSNHIDFTLSRPAAEILTQVTSAMQSPPTDAAAEQTIKVSDATPSLVQTPQATEQLDTATNSPTAVKAGTHSDGSTQIAHESSTVEPRGMTLREYLAPPGSPPRPRMEKKWTMTDNFDLSAEMQEVHAKMNRTTTNNNNLHKELASIKARLCDEKKREIDKLEAEYEAMFQARKRRLQLIEAKFVKVEKENESRIAEIMRLNRDLENTQGVAKDFERQTLNHIENIGKLLDKIEHFQQDIGFREEIFALKNANKALLDEKAELEYPPDVAKFAESERLRGISQDVIGFQYLEIKELKSELEEAKAAPELLAAEREAWAKEKKALQERISDYVTKEAQLLLDLLPERRPVDGVNMLVDGVDITVDKADLPMEGDGGSL